MPNIYNIDMKYNNVMAFELTPEIIGYDPIVQSNLNNWAASIGVNLMTPQGYSLAPLKVPLKFQIGTFYYYWLNLTAVAHRYGMDIFNHYIVLPITWLDEVYDTNEIEVVDEDTGEVTKTTVAILNKEHYRVHPNKVNDKCMVKLQDSDWKKLKEEIIYGYSEKYKLDNYPMNVLDNESFAESIAEGGDFYIEPVEKETNI